MLNIFQLKLKELKPEKERLCDVFFELFNYLKTRGIHNTSASKAIGKSAQTVSTWKSRGTGPKQTHIDALITAFPSQLADKAIELGIDLPIPIAAQQDGMIDALVDMIDRMEKELEELKELKQDQEMVRELTLENARLKIELAKYQKK